MSIQLPPIIENMKTETWKRWFQNVFNCLKGINTQDTSTFDGNINLTSGNVFSINGVEGKTETLTFGGGASGEVATITFTGGIYTSKTLVP